MDHSMNGALHHFDELLAAEAAQLTHDERLLVTDMVQQMLSTPAGSNLAAQLGQMLPSALLGPQQPQQQSLTAAALAAQELHYQRQPEQSLPAGSMRTAVAAGQMGSAGHSNDMLQHLPSTQFSLHSPPAGREEAKGLASPSSSGCSSSRSSPVNLQSRHASRSISPQHPMLRAPAQQPAPQAAAPAPAGPDVVTDAAADVLTAALADPNASIEEIVSMFDQVLTAGEENARELQQWLATQPQQQQPHQQEQQEPAHARLQHPLQQRAQVQWPATEQQQLQQQQWVPSHQAQLQPAPHAQPMPAALAGSKQSLVDAYLQEQRSPQHPLLAPAHPAGSPPGFRTPPPQPANSFAPQGPAGWTSVARPGTAPTGANSQPPEGHAAHAPHTNSSQHSAHTSLLAAAAAARRSQSPDVFKRLSATPTLSLAGRLAAGRRSESPVEAERLWAGSLRDSGTDSPSPARHRDSCCSSSRGCSPSAPQRAGHEVPWHAAAASQHCSPGAGPVEWDAGTRSAKGSGQLPGASGSMSRGRSPARAASGAEGRSSAFVQKPPARLPAAVLEERMRRFYERNVDWKKRCSAVYERQREQLKQEETDGCTFAPAINRKSDKIAQELRSSYPMRSIRPLTPLAEAAGDLERQLRKQQQQQQQQRRAASTGRMRQRQQQGSWLYGSTGSSGSCMSPRHAGASSGGGSEQSVPPAMQRLFQDATVRMQRAEQFEQATTQAERQARSWSAPRCAAAEGVSPRVYAHLDPDRSSSRRRNHNHADPRECAFKPWTNPRRKSKFPQSAAGSDPAEEHEVVEEFVALLDDAAGAEQQQAARPGTAPAASARSPQQQQQQQQRSPSSQRIGSATRNDDLDWDEFIERQSRHVGRIEQKVARAAAREQELRSQASPELSPGTRRILARKQALCANAGARSPTSRAAAGAQPSQSSPNQNFLVRLQQESESDACSGDRGSSGRRAGKPGNGSSSSSSGDGGGFSSSSSGGRPAAAECTFRPRITPKAAAKKGRSVEEMSEGDRLRREVRLEQLRVMSEARQLAGATFRPDLSPSRQREGKCFLSVPPKLSLSGEGLSAYMASLQEKRRQLEERRKMAESRRQEEELAACTFKPETTPVPAYITEMAEVGYTARYIDRVMQGALADARLGLAAAGAVKEQPTKAAMAPDMEGSPSPGRRQNLISTRY